jgi:hypothetical protein
MVQAENGSETKDEVPPGLPTEHAVRIAALVLAVVALAGVSAGAWLRLRRS